MNYPYWCVYRCEVYEIQNSDDIIYLQRNVFKRGEMYEKFETRLEALAVAIDDILKEKTKLTLRCARYQNEIDKSEPARELKNIVVEALKIKRENDR